MISEFAFFPTRTNPLQSSAMSGMNLPLPGKKKKESVWGEVAEMELGPTYSFLCNKEILLEVGMTF